MRLDGDLLCALRRDGELECRASVGLVPVPHGPFTDVDFGPDGPCALRTDGRLACWRLGHPDPAMRYAKVRAGCGLTAEGALVCPQSAQLPLPPFAGS